MTMIDELVSIILPVHNQAEHIEGTVAEYVAGLSRIRNSFEVLLVVNGCRDQSLAVCTELGARYPEVRVVFSERSGWGRAVKLGLEQARGEFLCYTNSARTRASDLVLAILFAMANPGAIIKTHRRSRESLDRRAGSFLYALECRILFSLPTWDINATPKVFSRSIYEAIRLTEDGDLLDLELYVQCARLGTPVLEVPIYGPTRHNGRSTTNLRSAFRLYWGAFTMWHSLRQRSTLANSAKRGPAER